MVEIKGYIYWKDRLLKILFQPFLTCEYACVNTSNLHPLYSYKSVTSVEKNFLIKISFYTLYIVGHLMYRSTISTKICTICRVRTIYISIIYI